MVSERLWVKAPIVSSESSWKAWGRNEPCCSSQKLRGRNFGSFGSWELGEEIDSCAFPISVEELTPIKLFLILSNCIHRKFGKELSPVLYSRSWKKVFTYFVSFQNVGKKLTPVPFQFLEKS